MIGYALMAFLFVVGWSFLGIMLFLQWVIGGAEKALERRHRDDEEARERAAEPLGETLAPA